MNYFIRRPDIELLVGIRVEKDTEAEFQNDNVKQTIKDLKLHSVSEIKGECYKSKYETTVELKEGDVLIFEENGRGYIKPIEPFVSVSEAIDDLTNIKDLGERNV